MVVSVKLADSPDQMIGFDNNIKNHDGILRGAALFCTNSRIYEWKMVRWSSANAFSASDDVK